MVTLDACVLNSMSSTKMKKSMYETIPNWMLHQVKSSISSFAKSAQNQLVVGSPTDDFGVIPKPFTTMEQSHEEFISKWMGLEEFSGFLLITKEKTFSHL